MGTEDFGMGLSKILTNNKIKVMADSTQEDEMFGGEWKKEMNQYKKADILESFAVIGTKAERARQLLGKVQRLLNVAVKVNNIVLDNNGISPNDWTELNDISGALEELEKEIENHLKQ